MTIFFVLPLWSKYLPYFYIFCYFERICLYNMEMSLAVMQTISRLEKNLNLKG